MKKIHRVILLIPLITITFVLLGTNYNHIILSIGQVVSIYTFVFCFAICILNLIFLDGIYPLRFKVLFIIAYATCAFLIFKTKAITYPVEWLEYRTDTMEESWKSGTLDKQYVPNHSSVAPDDSSINAIIVHPFSTHFSHYKAWMTLQLIKDSVPTYFILNMVGDDNSYGRTWAIEGLNSFHSYLVYDSISAPDTIILPVYKVLPTSEKEPVDTIVLTAVKDKR